MSQETYKQQLIRLVQAMSMANKEAAVSRDLSPHSAPSRVKMFVDGNLEKRLEKLQKQLEFVADAFDDFDELIVHYIRALPLAAYDSGTSDGERMLVWLSEIRRLAPEQQDAVACQRARHAIENLARKNRLKHVRFHERYSLVSRWLGELETNQDLQIHLNPIRTWTRFVSAALLDDDTPPPANVLFFAVGSEVSTAVLELEGQALINELADYEPCTLSQWAALTQLADRDELVSLSRDLADMGLVAFG
jgi:hypothetical protein